MTVSVRALLGAWLAIAMTLEANALSITPADTSVLKFSTHNQSAINAQIALFDPDLTVAYKMNVGGSEEGSFQASYETSFLNTVSDPSDATISNVLDPLITAPEKYLLVKDGNHKPYAYFFDISAWNGTDDLVLTGFWPQGGAISNVAIYTKGTAQVPDGGATLMLLGISLLGFVVVRRLAWVA